MHLGDQQSILLHLMRHSTIACFGDINKHKVSILRESKHIEIILSVYVYAVYKTLKRRITIADETHPTLHIAQQNITQFSPSMEFVCFRGNSHFGRRKDGGSSSTARGTTPLSLGCRGNLL